MIFTDRTITVKDNESTIDKPIILYRGDKEVEIRFTIMNSLYNYRKTSTTNLIETTEASWGQLVIQNTTTMIPLVSDIAATDAGRVTINITGEMIDEISEVGEYTFQIRLYNETKSSRVTLPEVIGGIIIKEPLSA